MKHRYFIILTALLLCAPFYANAGDGDKVGGIRLGWSSAAMFNDGTKLSGYENLQSFYIGFFRDNKIVPMLHLGTGLEYNQNGAQENSDNKWVLHYVSVPINLKLKIGPVYGLAGFAPSFKVSEKYIIDGSKTSPSSDEKSEWFDIPFHAGVGVKILFLSIEARYHWGMLDVNDGLKNQYFQLGAGISF